MPASVANAVAVGVLPKLICSAFSQSRSYAVLQNEYENGESQRNLQVASSQKSWHLSRPLTAAEAVELTTFYLDHKGPLIAFYMYDPYETVPQFSYDPTGTATSGRFTVHFKGSLEISLGLPRNLGQFELEELA